MKGKFKYMKDVKYLVKLKLPAGKARPVPPVSVALAPSKIDIINFCEEFNSLTRNLEGEISIGVLIFNDLSYTILSKEEVKLYESGQLNQLLSFLYKREEDLTFKGRNGR